MAEKKRKKSGIWWNILAGLLTVIGLVLLFQQPIRDFFLSMKISSQQSISQTITAEEIEKNNAEEADFDFDSVNPLSLQSVLQANMDNSKVKSIGEIAVPSVGINLTIAKGVSDLNMLVGAGTLRADQVMGEGNYPLASHYTNAGEGTLLFSPLHRVELGAKIYLTDLKNIYEYTIDWKETVHENRVDLIDDTPGEKIITLITCENLTSDNRVVVRGHLNQTYSVDNAPKEAVEAFKIVSKTL